MRDHRNGYPFKFPSTWMPPLDNGSPVISRNVWLRQAAEMHAKFKELNEGYAREYLWPNWYKWDKWQLWVLKVECIDYYPIIQTNAPAEIYWNSLKNIFTLLWFNRIRLDHLCSGIVTGKAIDPSQSYFGYLKGFDRLDGEPGRDAVGSRCIVTLKSFMSQF